MGKSGQSSPEDVSYCLKHGMIALVENLNGVNVILDDPRVSGINR